jgi:hypothetical protein
MVCRDWFFREKMIRVFFTKKIGQHALSIANKVAQLAPRVVSKCRTLGAT